MKAQKMETAEIAIDVSENASEAEIDQAIALLYRCKIEKAFDDFEKKPVPMRLRTALQC